MALSYGSSVGSGYMGKDPNIQRQQVQRVQPKEKRSDPYFSSFGRSPLRPTEPRKMSGRIGLILIALAAFMGFAAGLNNEIEYDY